MNIKHMFIGVVWFFLIYLNPVYSNNLTSDDLQKLKSYISEKITNKQISGAVLAIASSNQTILLESFGKRDVSTNIDMSNDLLFHIGSTNKAITSFLIGVLVDEGALTWDTKAIDIYPNFKLSNQTFANQITIRQLLSMTSGLPSDNGDDTSINSDYLDDIERKSARFILEGLTSSPALSEPNTKYAYSNTGYAMAAYLAVLAKAKADNGSITETDLNNLHARYETLLREKVLVPLGMDDAYLYIDDARATGKMTSSHHLESNTFVVSISNDQRVDNLAPSGGLKMPVNSLLRYVMTEMRQGISPDGKQVLSTKNTRERQQLTTGVAANEDYALGLEVQTLNNGIKYIGHAGSFDNFNSLMGFFPDQQIAFALSINAKSPQATLITEEFQQEIATLLDKDISTTPDEGNSNHLNYFELKISAALATDASVDYQTRDGTAIAGQDYITTTGKATIPAGQLSTLIAVEIIADTTAEEDQTFDMILTNPVGAAFANGVTEISRTHTIVDDD
jgi:CubicO group peptidase (beta-lactamase class C family)